MLAGEGAMPIVGPLSRRAAVKKIGAAAVATCGFAAGAEAQIYHPQDQTKLTKAAAKYQDQPKDDESCGGCPYFIAPASCVVVDGVISPRGWCPMFTTFLPLDRGAHS
jgi:hypothetical protein